MNTPLAARKSAFDRQMHRNWGQHDAVMYEKRFPGIKALADGLEFDKRAIETMKGWNP